MPSMTLKIDFFSVCYSKACPKAYFKNENERAEEQVLET